MGWRSRDRPPGACMRYAAQLGALEWSAQPVAEARTTVFQPVVDGDAVVAGYSTFGTPLAGGVVMVDRAVGPRSAGVASFRAASPAPRPGSAAARSSRATWSSPPVAMAGSTRSIGGTGAPRWVLPRGRAGGRPACRIATGARWRSVGRR